MRIITGLSLFLLLALVPVNMDAQATVTLGESKKLAGYNYKEKVENAGTDAKNLPLVIALHWSSSTPDEFAEYMTGFKKPVRILLLEGPYSHPREGFSFFVRSPNNYYEMSADGKMTNLLAEGEKLSKFIADATALYTPKKKPVIIGASQGGDLSYVIAIRYGSLISGSFPLLATVDERIVNNSFAKSAPINSYHGSDDPIVPIATAGQHIKLLQTSGYKAKLHTYKGAKHGIPHLMQADYIKKISRALF